MKPENARVDTAGRLAGLLLLLLVPLVVLVPVAPVPAWLAQDLVLRWGSALIFLFCFFSLFFPPTENPLVELDFLDLMVLLLTSWVLLSVKNSKEAFESFYAFRNFACLVLLWFSLRRIWAHRPDLFPKFEKVFFWTSVAAATWLCLSTLGHKTSLAFFQEIVPRKGFFINENVAAGFLGMALLWALFKWLHQRPVPLWATGLFFLAWTLTQSRGAFVAMLAVVILYLMLHMKEIESRIRVWKPSQWILFAGVVVFFIVCTSFTVYKLFNPQEVDARASNRWDLWSGGLKMVLDQPLLGFGPGTFPDAFPAYQPASIWNTYVAAAHNEYLQVAIECGWPALLLTLFFLWGIFRETGRRLFQTPVFKEVAGDIRISETVFFMVLLEALHNGLDFTFHDWSHRLVLLAFVTFALKENKAGDDITTVFRFSRRAYLGGVGLLVLAVLWIMGVGAFRDYLARLYDFKATLAYQQYQLDEAESYERSSLRLRGDFMKPWNLLGALEDIRGEKAADPAERKKYFQSAEEYYGRAALLSPYALEPLENKVHFLVVQRRLSEALELQNLLADRSPQNPVEYIQRAQILLAMGRAQDSILSAQKAVDLDDYFIPGYVAKAQAMEALGKRADAVLIYKNIEEIIKKQNIPDLEKRLSEVEADIRSLQGKRQ